jgi:hypothetical protein
MAINRPEAPPTTRQIYALAGEVCERMGETFPKTRGDASETIERLRIENGHPAPRLEDSPRALRRRRDGKPKSEKTLAFARLARELREE